MGLSARLFAALLISLSSLSWGLPPKPLYPAFPLRPANGSALATDTAKVAFAWSRVALPAGAQPVQYRLRIVPLYLGQSPMQAFQTNPIALDQSALKTESATWQPKNGEISDGQSFVWAVQASSAGQAFVNNGWSMLFSFGAPLRANSCDCACPTLKGLIAHNGDSKDAGALLLSKRPLQLEAVFDSACPRNCPQRVEGNWSLSFIPTEAFEVEHTGGSGAYFVLPTTRSGRLIAQFTGRVFCNGKICKGESHSMRREFLISDADDETLPAIESAPASPASGNLENLSPAQLRDLFNELAPRSDCSIGDAFNRAAEESRARFDEKLETWFKASPGEQEGIDHELGKLRSEEFAGRRNADESYRRCFWARHPVTAGTLYSQRVPLPAACSSIAGLRALSEAGSSFTDFLDADHPLRQGQERSAYRHYLGRNTRVLMSLSQDSDGRPQLHFASGFLNHFHFRLDCLDEKGNRGLVSAQSTQVRGSDGRGLDDNACEGPYFGDLRLVLCGVDERRLDAGSETLLALNALLGRAAASSGGRFRLTQYGSARDAKGRAYRYAEGRVAGYDMCSRDVASKLESLAQRLKAQSEVRGSLVLLRGSDAAGECPGPPSPGGLNPHGAR